MKNSTDVLRVVLFDDPNPLRDYFEDKEVTLTHKFTREHMDVIAKNRMCIKSESLSRFTKLSVEEVVGLQFLSRHGCMNTVGISEWLASKYVKLGKMAQTIGEIELYLLYDMKKQVQPERFKSIVITRGLIHPYHKIVVDNMQNEYYHTRFKKLLEEFKDHYIYYFEDADE